MTPLPTPTFLSDHQWLLLQPLFPASHRGRPPLDDRLVLENIFYKLSTRLPWYDIPSASPSWQACYQRLHHWQRTGLWKSILTLLIADLRDRGGFDLLALWQGHQLSLAQADSGEFQLACPPEFTGTWQHSTAFNLLMALSSGFLPSHHDLYPHE